MYQGVGLAKGGRGGGSWEIISLPVNIGELAKAETIPAGGISVTVNDDASVVAWHLENFAHLLVQFKVRDVAPVLWRSLCRQTCLERGGRSVSIRSYGLHRLRANRMQAVVPRRNRDYLLS